MSYFELEFSYLYMIFFFKIEAELNHHERPLGTYVSDNNNSTNNDDNQGYENRAFVNTDNITYYNTVITSTENDVYFTTLV